MICFMCVGGRSTGYSLLTVYRMLIISTFILITMAFQKLNIELNIHNFSSRLEDSLLH